MPDDDQWVPEDIERIINEAADRAVAGDEDDDDIAELPCRGDVRCGSLLSELGLE